MVPEAPPGTDRGSAGARPRPVLRGPPVLVRAALALAAGSWAVLAVPAAGQDTGEATGTAVPTPPAALAALGDLILGTWEADGSRHHNEWGVGRRVIRSRSWSITGEGTALVSEGVWWWDGEAQTLRGLHFAVGMPMERMEYETRVEGSRVVHDLRTFGGMEGRFLETWTFAGDGYEWTLERPADGTPQRVMGGRYQRVDAGSGGP